MAEPESDDEFLTRLSSLVRSRPQDFLLGGRLLDERYSVAEFRHRRAETVCRHRRHYREEIRKVEEARRTALAAAAQSGKAKLSKQQRAEFDKAEVHWRSTLRNLTDPCLFEWRRYRNAWPKHLRLDAEALGVRVSKLAHRECDADLHGKLRSNACRRLATAVDWARGPFGLPNGFAAPSSSAELQSVCVLAWLLFDPEAPTLDLKLCEFQALPWEWNTVIDGVLFQGREYLEPKLRGEDGAKPGRRTLALADAARRALSRIEIAWIQPPKSTAADSPTTSVNGSTEKVLVEEIPRSRADVPALRVSRWIGPQRVDQIDIRGDALVRLFRAVERLSRAQPGVTAISWSAILSGFMGEGAWKGAIVKESTIADYSRLIRKRLAQAGLERYWLHVPDGGARWIPPSVES